ncbi:Protein FAM162A [Lonchura striata]|uniref:Protein FAM162A n=1 Tax=Lonchura striata TaxID=40157 RepID=A0A218V3E8_9PASE|nr:Protein FAM162A [Lonchura striata domestica]
MLGRLLGHSAGLWQRVALLVLCPTRSAGSRAENAQDMALQMAYPGYSHSLCQTVAWIMRQGAGIVCSQMNRLPGMDTVSLLSLHHYFHMFFRLSSLLFTKSLTGKEAFRNERRPTSFDRKVLVWSGRLKKEEDIPRHVLSEVLDTARNIARIKVCYVMIALTVLGCVAMIITSKEVSIVSEGTGSLNVWSILALMREASSFLRQGIELRLCWFAVVLRETKGGTEDAVNWGLLGTHCCGVSTYRYSGAATDCTVKPCKNGQSVPCINSHSVGG